MKTISKTLIIGGTVGLMAIVVGAVSSPLFAVEEKTTTTPKPATTSQEACTHIVTLAESSKTTLGTHLTEMQSDFSSRLSHISSDESGVDQKVAAARATATANFEAKIKALEGQSGLTAAQMQAIETFQTNVLQAKTTREAAVDTARAAYRTGLQNLVATHQATLEAAVVTYQTAVDDAFATAEAHCGDGTAVANLKTTVKAAREDLTHARQSDQTTGAAIKQLAATRNSAIKTADTAFKAAISSDADTLANSLKATH